MNYSFETLKQELRQLLQLIRHGEETLEDARRRLNEPIEKERKKMMEELESYRQDVEHQLEEKRLELGELATSYFGIEGKEVVIRLAQEKSHGFPWLASAYDDYFYLKDLALANYLERKTQPALKAAEQLRQIAKERREAEKAARIAENLLQYCRFLAPWLDEYVGMQVEELDQIIKDIHLSWEKKEAEFDEEVKRHFGPKFESLTATEKLQRKLDWYWEKPNKSNWQIGRDYERYTGYLYENKGWDVYYHGKKGFEDLGRDLICKKSSNVEIVQCKYWAREKMIHEKHIYYLFGTTVEYCLEHYASEKDAKQLALLPELVRNRSVVPKLITTTKPSAKAEQVADALGVVIEIIPFERYPSVKCNVSRRTGEKIFHLPFDQQYDNILIEEERLECYVDMVAEAESLGFRHAYRWKGELKDQS